MTEPTRFLGSMRNRAAASAGMPRGRGAAILVATALVAAGSGAFGQTIVYRPIVTGFAPAAGPYVANYTPAGNYAAVTAFSPPVAAAVPMAAISTPLAAMVPASSVAVTSYAAPVMTTVARPVTAAYAPSYAASYATTSAFVPAGGTVTVAAPMTVTSFYAPAAPLTVAAPVAVAAPMAVPMAPAAVAVPLYRRGPFGGLRPVRAAYWPAY